MINLVILHRFALLLFAWQTHDLIFFISISVTLSMAWPDSFITFHLGGGVIPLPGKGIVGKNRSARSKTTVRINPVFYNLSIGIKQFPFSYKSLVFINPCLLIFLCGYSLIFESI